MKYTCVTCQYSTNDKSNFNRHLKRKRKCVLKTTRKRPENDQKVPENDQEEASRGAVEAIFGNPDIPIGAVEPIFGNPDIPIGAVEPIFGNPDIPIGAKKSVFEDHKSHKDNKNEETKQNVTKIWECKHCNKTFAHNTSWNRHIKSRCKVLKWNLEQENFRLKKEIEKLKAEKKAEASRITNNTTNNTTNNNTTNNNTMNNNTININNIQLPDGVWTRKLYRVMAHLMAKTKGDRFSPGEIDFYDAFQKTMSVAFYHPESPVYDTVQMLGRKEPWAKHNGKIVRKRKLLKKINQEHYQRLIQMMNADNERFRKELPPAPVIEQWMEVNNEVIRNIKKYDPCEKTMIQNAEEVFRSKSLIGDFNRVVEEVKKADRMDRDIAHSQARDTQRMVNGN